MARHARPGKFESLRTRGAEAMSTIRDRVAAELGALVGREWKRPDGHLTMRQLVEAQQRTALVGPVFGDGVKIVEPVPAPERPAPAAGRSQRAVRPEFVQDTTGLWPAGGVLGVEIPGAKAFGGGHLRVSTFETPAQPEAKPAVSPEDVRAAENDGDYVLYQPSSLVRVPSPSEGAQEYVPVPPISGGYQETAAQPSGAPHPSAVGPFMNQGRMAHPFVNTLPRA